MENEDFEEVSQEEISEIFEVLLEQGYLILSGMSENGEPLYRFSQELLEMDEFQEVHEAILNDMLFAIWNKGFIEMYPENEDGDWHIDLCDKSQDMEAAKAELDEDEYILFVQIYDELSKNTEV